MSVRDTSLQFKELERQLYEQYSILLNSREEYTQQIIDLKKKYSKLQQLKLHVQQLEDKNMEKMSLDEQSKLYWQLDAERLQLAQLREQCMLFRPLHKMHWNHLAKYKIWFDHLMIQKKNCRYNQIYRQCFERLLDESFKHWLKQDEMMRNV